MATFLMLAGRIVLGGFFVFSGYKHFAGSKMLTGYAASKKVPMPKVAVLGSGLLMVLGGATIILNDYVVMGLWFLIVTTLGMTVMMHDFWKETDATKKMNENIAFMKNMALVGALCLLLSKII